MLLPHLPRSGLLIADCLLPTWVGLSGEAGNIAIEAARQRELDSLSLRPVEPRSGSFEVRWNRGARQTARELCLMKLTARFLCPTTVHGLQEMMLS